MKISVILVAILAGTAGVPVAFAGTEYWAAGVSREVGSGWNDFTQSGNTCWAASASVILDWWVKQMRANGYEPAAGAPTDYDAIYSDLTTNVSSGGGYVQQGLNYYLKKYYPDQAQQTSYQYYRENYYNKTDTEALARLVELIMLGIPVGVDIEIGSGSNYHVYTVWGCEVDDDGVATKLFMTDSAIRTADYGFENGLEIWNVSIPGNYVNRSVTYISGGAEMTVTETWDIVRFNYLTVVDAIPVPEPSLFGGIAGTLALILAGTRRRRERADGGNADFFRHTDFGAPNGDAKKLRVKIFSSKKIRVNSFNS